EAFSLLVQLQHGRQHSRRQRLDRARELAQRLCERGAAYDHLQNAALGGEQAVLHCERRPTVRGSACHQFVSRPWKATRGKQPGKLVRSKLFFFTSPRAAGRGERRRDAGFPSPLPLYLTGAWLATVPPRSARRSRATLAP